MIRSLLSIGPKIGLVVGVLACGLALVWPGVVSAQAPPQALPQPVIGAAQLTDQQKAQIQAYVGHWTAVFTCAASSADVERARDELMRPLGGINQQISPSFRLEYSLMVLPPLQTLLNAGCPENQHVLPNVIRVIEALGSDKALNTLLQHADAISQKSFQLRLSAARGCAEMLKKGAGLEARRFVEAARKLRDAIGREDNGQVLWWQLAAINATDGEELKAPEDRAKVHEHHVEAFNALVKRLLAANNNPHPSPLFDPMPQAMGDLLRKFNSNAIAATEAADVAKKLGWSIGQVLQVVLKNWDAAQDKTNAQRRGIYGQAVGAVEGFLPYIDGIARGPGKAPTTTLKKAWDAGDKAAFETEAKKWLDVLGQAPYVKP